LSTVVSGKSAPSDISEEQLAIYNKGCIHSVEKILIRNDDIIPEELLFLHDNDDMVD